MIQRFLLLAVGLIIPNGTFADSILPDSQSIAANYLRRVADYAKTEVDIMILDRDGNTPERVERIKQVITEVVDMSIAAERPSFELNEISFSLNEFRRTRTTKPEFFLCYTLAEHLHSFPEALVEMMNSLDSGLLRLMRLLRRAGVSQSDMIFALFYPVRRPWLENVGTPEIVESLATNEVPLLEGMSHDDEFFSFILLFRKFGHMEYKKPHPFSMPQQHVHNLRSLPESHEGKKILFKALDVLTRLSTEECIANRQHYDILTSVFRQLSAALCVSDITEADDFFLHLPTRIGPSINVMEQVLVSRSTIDPSLYALKSQLIAKVISSQSSENLVAQMLVQWIERCRADDFPLCQVLVDVSVAVIAGNPPSLIPLVHALIYIFHGLLSDEEDHYISEVINAAFIFSSRFGVSLLRDYPNLVVSRGWSEEKVLAVGGIIECLIHFDHRSEWERDSLVLFPPDEEEDGYVSVASLIARASEDKLKHAASVLSVLNKELLNAWTDAPLVTPVAFLREFLAEPLSNFATMAQTLFVRPPPPNCHRRRIISEMFLCYNPQRVEVYAEMERRVNYISEHYRGRVPVDVMDQVSVIPSEFLVMEINSVPATSLASTIDKVAKPTLELVEAVGEGTHANDDLLRECISSVLTIVQHHPGGPTRSIDEFLNRMQQITHILRAELPGGPRGDLPNCNFDPRDN